MPFVLRREFALAEVETLRHASCDDQLARNVAERSPHNLGAFERADSHAVERIESCLGETPDSGFPAQVVPTSAGSVALKAQNSGKTAKNR
jgi:hypothetical protein